MIEKSNFGIKLNLANFIGAKEIICKDSYGEENRGIFIPYMKNNVYKKYKELNVYFSVFKTEANAEHETHRLLLNKTKKFMEYLKEKGVNDFVFNAPMGAIIYNAPRFSQKIVDVNKILNKE